MEVTQFSLRIDDDVVRELDVEAARNRMSRVGMVEAILRERYGMPAQQIMKRSKSSARKKTGGASGEEKPKTRAARG